MISDPSVENMNYTQWLFELESLKIKEEKKYDEIKSMVELFKNSMVGMLGLNVMPIEDEDGLLREPNENEITPLSMLVASPEMMQVVYKRRQELEDQKMIQEDILEESQCDLEDAEDLLNELDGDIEFLNSQDDFDSYVKKQSYTNQVALRQLLDNFDEVSPDVAEKLDKVNEEGGPKPFDVKELEKIYVDIQQDQEKSDKDPFEDLERELNTTDKESALKRRKKRILID